ncbi:hypothetical protein MHBO_003549, partial [Bonamia ostreae]
MTEDMYLDIERRSVGSAERIVVICDGISQEATDLINSSVENRVIAIRMPVDEGLDYFYDDLTFMINASVDGEGITSGRVKELRLSENGITVFGFDRTDDEIYQYCEALDKNFVSSDPNDKTSHSIRLSKLLANDSFDILLNCKTIGRYRMLSGMLEDVYKSKKEFDKG